LKVCGLQWFNPQRVGLVKASQSWSKLVKDSQSSKEFPVSFDSRSMSKKQQP
jgi:hypothetical protein